MERRMVRDLGERARGDCGTASGRRPLPGGDRDPDQALRHRVRLGDLPRGVPEFIDRPRELDPEDLEAVPQPREVRVESKWSAAVSTSYMTLMHSS